MSLLQTTGINVLYELANLARGQVTAHISPKSWWANMQQGMVWDLDDFAVNQIGHPYQGSNYFNAGRAGSQSNGWMQPSTQNFGPNIDGRMTRKTVSAARTSISADVNP